MNTFKILFGRVSIVLRRTEYLGGPIVIALALLGSVLRPGLFFYGQAVFTLAMAVTLAVACTSERDRARSLAWFVAGVCWAGHGYHYIGGIQYFGEDSGWVTASMVLCAAMLLVPLVGLVLTSWRPVRPGVTGAAEAVLVVAVMAVTYGVGAFLSLFFYNGAEPWWTRVVFLFMALPWALAAWLRPGRRLAYASAALPQVLFAAFPAEVFADPLVFMWLAFGFPVLGAAAQSAPRLRRRMREPEAAAVETPSGGNGEINLPTPQWRS